MRARIARLHLGQLLILMAVVAMIGYGIVSAMADELNGVARRMWHQPLTNGFLLWSIFFLGFVMIGLASWMGHAWSIGKRVGWAASLCFTLFFPAVIGVWSWRSYSSARAESSAHRQMEYSVFDTMPPTRIDRQIAYDNVAGWYGLFVMLSVVITVVVLYRWFGERARRQGASE